MKSEHLLVEISSVKNPVTTLKCMLELFRKGYAIIYIAEPTLFRFYPDAESEARHIVAGVNSIVILSPDMSLEDSLKKYGIKFLRVKGPTWFKGRRVKLESAMWKVENSRVKTLLESTGLSYGKGLYVLEVENSLIFSKEPIEYSEVKVYETVQFKSEKKLKPKTVLHPIISGLDFRRVRVFRVSKIHGINSEIPLVEVEDCREELPILTIHPRETSVKLYSTDVFKDEEFSTRLLTNIVVYLISEEGNFKA